MVGCVPKPTIHTNIEGYDSDITEQWFSVHAGQVMQVMVKNVLVSAQNI